MTSKRASAPPYEPQPFDQARRQWFERWGAVEVQKNRWFIAFLAALAANIALAAAIFALVPLKTVVPYVVQVDEAGRAAASPAAAQRYEPGEREIKYFLAEWARKLYTLDKTLTERWLQEAYAFTAERASSEFADWVQRERPIAELAENPRLTRTVNIVSISLLPGRVALIRLIAETRRSESAPPSRTPLLITASYAIIEPKTEEQILRNPIGLYVTHFSAGEEVR